MGIPSPSQDSQAWGLPAAHWRVKKPCTAGYLSLEDPDGSMVLAKGFPDGTCAPKDPKEQTVDMHSPAMDIVLASTSVTRQAMLNAAGIGFSAVAPRVDEVLIRDALVAEGAHPRDIADTLAEMKARKVAEKHRSALVLGCDQVLALDWQCFAKPETPEEARGQLRQLRGKTHKLLTAIVAYENAEPVWRHVAEARLTMHQISDGYLDDYVARNWDSIRHSVGGYKIEEEGVRLFSAIQGDHFTILGLPLLPLLAWLGTKGIIAR